MRIVSKLGTILGVIVLLAGIGVLSYGAFQVWQQFLAISADRSKEFVNPLPMTLLGAAVTSLGSFLFGLSLHRGIGRADVVREDGTTVIR